MLKRRGSNYERELQRKFWEKGFPCFRIAGSGSSSFPATDLIAIYKNIPILIEVKTTRKDKIYLDLGQIEELKKLKEKNLEIYIAVKFIGKTGWYLIELDKVLNNNKIDLDRIKKEGIKLEDFLAGQKKLF